MNLQKYLCLVPILYLISWSISPPLSYGVLYRIASIAFVVYLLNKNWAISNEEQRNRFYYSIFLIIYMVILGLIVQDKFVQRIHAYIFLLVGITTDIWNNKHLPKNCYWYIIIFTFLLYIVWNICSINALFQNSHIMRALVRNSEESYIYSQKGVGGYGYLYSVVIALPLGISILLNKFYDKKLRLTSLIFIVSSLYLVFLSEYFMAVILAVAIIPLIFVSRVKSKNKRLSAYCLIVLVLMILFLNAESIIAFLVNETDSATMQKKLTDSYMIMANDGEVNDSEFGTRAKRYGHAIDAFISNPLFGSLTYRNVGNHSYILDYFGQYGFLIGLAFIYLFSRPITRYLRHSGTVTVVLFITVIVALFNVLPLASIAPLYILLPAVCKYNMRLENEE